MSPPWDAFCQITLTSCYTFVQITWKNCYIICKLLSHFCVVWSHCGRCKESGGSLCSSGQLEPGSCQKIKVTVTYSAACLYSNWHYTCNCLFCNLAIIPLLLHTAALVACVGCWVGCMRGMLGWLLTVLCIGPRCSKHLCHGEGQHGKHSAMLCWLHIYIIKYQCCRCFKLKKVTSAERVYQRHCRESLADIWFK